MRKGIPAIRKLPSADGRGKLKAMVVAKILQVASGFLELGLAEDALLELQELPEDAQKSLAALEIKVNAQMENRAWNAACETARLQCALEPVNAGYFLRAAFCLHETGDTLAAKNWLLRGPKALLALPTFHYNMGCYLWVLGERTASMEHLRQAFEMDRSLLEHARTDRDLDGWTTEPN